MHATSGRRWLAAFGNGDWGRLGLGSDWLSRTVPTAVLGLPPAEGPAVAVAAGGAHTVALLASGRVYACGLNDEGQTGSPRVDGGWHCVPKVPYDVCNVSAGDSHSMACTSSGELWEWGAGRTTPVRIDLDAQVCSVSAGSQHSLALTTSGELYAWGERDATGVGYERFGSSRIAAPRLVRSLRGCSVSSISAGRGHSAVADTDGRLFVFGRLASSVAREPALQIIGGIAEVSCGGHTLAVTRNADVHAMGSNANGALGIGNESGGSKPRLLSVSLQQVSAGWRHSCGINGQGHLFCWGWGGSVGDTDSSSGASRFLTSLICSFHLPGGQLGLGDDMDRWTACKVPLPPGTRCLQVSAGYNHTVAVMESA
jgi:alpha-tubulin suppressor-like RCC1 family protein